MSLTAEQEAFLASIEAKGSRPDKASILGTPLMLTDDGGRIYDTSEGLVFTSPGYSTSDQKVIREIIEQQKKKGGKTPKEMAESRIRQDILGQAPIASRGAAAIQGLPFVGEYVDELIGLASPRIQQNVRAAQSAMSEEYPITTGALQTGTAIAATAPFLPARVAGTTLEKALKTSGLGAVFGGAEGGVSGYGRGETPEQRMESAKSGAMFGAGGGSAGGFAAPYLERGISRLFDKPARTLAAQLGISVEAAQVIRSTFSQGGNMQDAVTAVQQAGRTGMIADANAATKAMTDAVAATGGEASEIVSSSVRQRAETAGRDLSSQLDETLGDVPAGTRSVLEEVAGRSASARGRLYDAALGSPIDYTSTAGAAIESLFERIPDRVKVEAIRRANEAMQMEGTRGQTMQIRAIIGDDGSVSFSEMPNMTQLNELKIALQEMAQDMVNPRTGQMTAEGIRYQKIAGELRGALTEANPIYGRAVDLGGEKIQEENAFMLGLDMLKDKTTREQVQQGLSGITQAQRDLVRRGVRSNIDETLANVKSSIDAGGETEIAEARRLLRNLSSRANRDKLQMLLSPEEYAEFERTLMQSYMAMDLRASTARGSQTAIRQQVQGDIEQATSGGMLRNIQQGKPAMATQDIIKALTGATDEFTVQQRQAVYADLARVLVGRQGKDAQAALNYIQQAVENGKIDQKRAAFVANVISRASIPAGSETAQ
jgi:hypothetical protein